MTIRTRLALWYSGLLTLIIIIFSIAVISVSRVTTLQAVDQWLAQVADTVIANIEIETTSAQVDDVSLRSVDNLHTPGLSIQLWHIANSRTGQHHAPVTLFDSEAFNYTSTSLNVTALLATEPQYDIITINNVAERVLTRPIYTDTGIHYGVVQVSTPIQSLTLSNSQLLLIIVISALICIIFSIVLGISLSRHLLKPVNAITHAAATIVDAEDLSTRLDWQGPKDELGELAEVFNHMMARLERLFNVQQRFIGDVSHELRTPLTSILGNLELMSLYGVEQDSMDAIQRETNRMNRMVNNLLLLTRADYGELELEFYPIDLHIIAKSVFDEAVIHAENRQLSIERLEPVEMVANGERLRQLIANLLHNAIKFTNDGGNVSLSVFKEQDAVIIEVRDTGIGVSQDNQKHIFDRFFQADTSRVHRDDTDGAGLGLSIVRWIVDAHQGSIDVQSDINQGTVFRVQLPNRNKAHKIIS